MDVILVLALPTILTCQSVHYPHLRDVGIHVRVSQTSGSEFFHYAYQLNNDSPSGGGRINRFEIDISQSRGALDLDTVGLLFNDDGFTERSFRRNFPRLTGKIVPVSFVGIPAGTWTGSFSNDLTAVFHDGVTNAINPGDSLDGFELMSKGLPGIRRCIVSPFLDVIALFPDPNDTTITYYVPPVDSVRNAVKFHAFTIGPTAPPASFSAATFLDTLISYKHQAFALGWIKEEGIVISLDAKLEAARVQIINDRPSAKQILQSFVNELEALNTQSNKISSEAYALLKFNAQYLISRL